MRNHSKNFFSKKKAQRFAEELEFMGATDIILCAFRDAFDQTQYRVEWNF